MTALDVVTGFLGSGKTTFISRYAGWLERRGESYCIIENEFGRAGVDGALLREQGARVKEISGGCVCCTLKVALHDLLIELSGQVERILLEPSGLFCGDDLLDILKSPDVAGAVRLGLWTGLIDPLAAGAMTDDDIAVLKSELMAAGSVVISKAQFADEAELASALSIARGLQPEPMVWSEPWDALEDDDWFPAMRRQGAVKRAHERVCFDHAAMFQSATLTPKGRFTEPSLRARLTAMLSGGAGNVLRVKGVAAARGGGGWRINGTPGCPWIAYTATESQPMLNVIGRGLHRGQLNALLEEDDE